MLAWALHDKVLHGDCRRHDFGPDAGIARLQAAIRKARPVAADRTVEALGARRINIVVDRLDPLDIGSEFRLPAEIERQMHAEAAGLGNGIDQV